MTDEVMMIPVQEFKQLQDYYKGQMTQSALLNKAGRLAAEEHLNLKNKSIPDSLAIKMTKPLAAEQGRLVKCICTGTPGPLTYQGTEESEGMVDTPAENLLKQIIKGVNKDPAAPIVIKQESVTPPSKIKKEPPTSGVKKEVRAPKRPILTKPSSSKKPGFKVVSKRSGLLKKSGIGKAALSDAKKDLLKSLGISEEGGYSAKGAKKEIPQGQEEYL